MNNHQCTNGLICTHTLVILFFTLFDGSVWIGINLKQIFIREIIPSIIDALNFQDSPEQPFNAVSLVGQLLQRQG